MKRTILFNPVSIVHARNMRIFRDAIPDYNLRCIYNPNLPWAADMKKGFNDETVYFKKGHFPSLPKGAFREVAALVLFTSQPRVPPCNLIQEATLHKIPIIAIEEVCQMMLQQGLLNNYFLPTDHFFVASGYEKEKFVELGVSPEIMEITGYIFGNNKCKATEHKPTLTVCLDALSSGADTLGIFRKMLICLAQGLPNKYGLLIKPHPEDRKSDFVNLVKEYFPDAKIADPMMDIGRILDVTDILLNRGNSQVTIDALQKNIPAIVMPFGKKTFFHDFLDEVIVKENNLADVINLIEAKGMDLYEGILKKYLPIPQEEALKAVISRISQIAEAKAVYKPEERLLELALFWAWMGYASMALEILRKLPRNINDNGLPERICRLVLCRANKEDLFFLKRRYGNTYREWILQCLWIKMLYLRHKKMDSQDKEWLADYPPAMNRRGFLPYALLLAWCYFNSGMHKEEENLINNLCKESGALKTFQRLKSLNLPRKRGLIFDISYLISRTKYKGFLTLKNIESIALN